MARLKKTVLLLMAVVLIVHFSAAQMDDEDDDSKETMVVKPTTTTTKKPEDSWENKECYITNARASNYRLYMKSLWKGFRVAYTSKYKESSKWIITPVKVAGNNYFEIYNKERKTYMGASKRSASGNHASHEKSESTKTLFTIEPPKQGVPVYIKSFKGTFLSEPKKSKKSVAMKKYKSTQWVIRCA